MIDRRAFIGSLGLGTLASIQPAVLARADQVIQ
jgi:hypothetical protein